ncbi:glycoside hydrolase family 88 protein [Cohnella fermenti]|uniref:Glucuronyl hydrolase n=1 Tax=Cohnella fermenti TaxID=2565925 RepID=A0A4S4BMV0_9BACL|nr:glycoside hydrolase family 88 protein [Cohnella fermenti]THF76095.1 glucuronyl hydrolase [Cohnella fermenti]
MVETGYEAEGWTAEAERELERITERIRKGAAAYGTRFPHLSRDGVYSNRLNEDGSWTGSFWTGMVLLAYRLTGDSEWLAYLSRYLPVYEHRLREGYLDHDVGFLYQLYAVKLYDATGAEGARSLAVGAADELLKRFNPAGGFIRAWGRLEEDRLRGKMIIDCLLNLPLLWSATRLTGNPAYASAAERHARQAMKHHIRPDGSSYHTFDFDPDTGEPIGGFNEGGYADESCWSRGQAWGIYGFALAYRHTGDPSFAAAAAAMADYFVARLPEDEVPLWDFKLPEGEAVDAAKDASAAAIACCGLLELSRCGLFETERRLGYERRALRMLASLRKRYTLLEEADKEAVLKRCYGRVEGVVTELSAIWGDYYYMEAHLLASGRQPDMWTTTSGSGGE